MSFSDPSLPIQGMRRVKGGFACAGDSVLGGHVLDTSLTQQSVKGDQSRRALLYTVHAIAARAKQ